MGALLVQAGDQTLLFDARFTVGRKDRGADMELDDEYVSNMHAAFSPDGDGWAVEDLGSTNGTWLNGARVWGPVPLSKGDKVRVGHTTITVVPA